MQNLKFRAWDESNKVMHNDFQCIRSGTDGNDWIVLTSDKQPLTSEPHPFKNPYFQMQLKQMQWTGMLDRDGKEIYEGDIVVRDHYPFYDNGELNYIGTVEFIYSCWQYVTWCVNPEKRGISNGMNNLLNEEGYGTNERSCWKVIGNIYENPELLGTGYTFE